MSYTAKTRIILRRDTETNWNQVLDTVPLRGELLIYEADGNHEHPRIKIGDGVNNISNLPFLTPESVLRYDVAQKLTDKQKEIVWENLGITPNQGPTEETTDVEFYYDGDYSGDTYEWVTNYSDVRIFARVGDVPKGTLNLVDGVASSITPSNTWLNYSVILTEEKLNETIIKYDTEIYAKQTGLIQYFYQAAFNNSMQTIFLICTKPGWYNLAFDDWFETINITKAGVYFYDSRPLGGNSYLQSLNFTVTTTTGGGTVVEEVTPITYKGNDIQVFHRGICIGDSVTEGSFDDDANGAIIKKYAYPEYLGRLMNAEVVNAGIAGATSQTWYEASLNSDSMWGRWINQGWVWNTNPPSNGSDDIQTVLDYSGFDFAVIHLGINDIGLMGDATIEDTLTAFEWYTNQIINKLKEANSGIKIFLATIIPSYAPAGNTQYEQLNRRIETIVGYSTDVYLLDLNYYSECTTDAAFNVIHPTALGYQKIATEIYSMISYIIQDNRDEFKEVQFCNKGVEDKPDVLTKSNWYTNAKIEELIGSASENCQTLGQIEWALSDLYTNKANAASVYTKDEVDVIVNSLRSVVLAQGNAASLAIVDDIADFSLIAIEGSFTRGSSYATIYFAHLLNISELLNGAAVSVSVLDGGQAYNYTCNVSLVDNTIAASDAIYIYGNNKTGDATATIQKIIGIR